LATDTTRYLGSIGYGFVRFGDESEQLRSLQEMYGVYCGSRPIRISMATPKNKTHASAGGMSGMGGMGGAAGGPSGMGMGMGMGMPAAGYGYPPQPPPAQSGSPQHSVNQFTDPNNTTVFVGGLTGVTNEDELRNAFAMFGDITYVKIPLGKGCGFVQFVHRQSAEMAINQLNGYQIGKGCALLSYLHQLLISAPVLKCF
jgi:RNA recognition motif-containing protein